MPRPNKRSRTFRRVYLRTPKGVSKLVYKRRKPESSKCGICHKPLHGIPRGLPYQLRTLPKSSKKPKRMFGGNLCSSCAKREIIKRVRK